MADNNQENKVTELVLEEHAEFDSLSESKMIKSRQFAGMVASIFINVFEDFEGCIPTLDTTTNRPVIEMIFNHKEQPAPDSEEAKNMLPFACTKDIDTKTKNETIQRVRNLRHRQENGDTYSITETGRKLLERFILNTPRSRDRNGNVRWRDLVSPVANGGNGNIPPQQQFTKLCYLDVNKLARFIYGGKTPNGGNWIYTASLKKSIPSPVVMNNLTGTHDFIMEITRIDEEEVKKQATNFGIGVNMSGLDIVRSLYQ